MSIKSRILKEDLNQVLNENVVVMKEISGMGIQTEQDDVTTEDLIQLLNKTNQSNQEIVNTMLQENQRAIEEEREREENRLKEIEKAALLKRYEEEQRLRAIKEQEEAEERARIEAEIEARKSKSIIRKVSKGAETLFSKKSNTTKASNESVSNEDDVISYDEELQNDPETENINDDVEEVFDDMYIDDSLYIDESIEDLEASLEPEELFSETETPDDLDNLNNLEQSNDTTENSSINKNLSIDDSAAEDINEPVLSPEVKEPKTEPKISNKNSNKRNIKNPFAKKQLTDDEKDKEIERLRYAAYNDQMTGLLNKASYEERIKNLKVKGNLAVIYFDVNNLKLTNDTIGHEAGDSLITEAAKQIQDKFPGDGFRTGGDEFIAVTNRYKKKVILEKIDAIYEYMENLTKNDLNGIRYSVSIGYAFVENGKTFKDLCSFAEEMMYAQKKDYKEKLKKELGNKYVDPRASDKEILDAEKPTDSSNLSDDQYDALLTKDQRELKQQIQQNHIKAMPMSVGQILMEIQKRHADIEAILIASKDFNQLFILQDVNNFIRLVRKMESNIDFTYLYVLYRGGPQYYGIDEYTSEITHLFEEISSALLKRQIKTAADFQKVKGINIFKQIHSDI